MSNGLFKVVVLMLMLILIGMVGCGEGKTPEQKRQEGRLEKMRPKAEDRLSTLMDRSWDNLEYMIYGFMNYDNEKIKTSAANLSAISPYMAQRISPQYYEYKTVWGQQCKQQQEIVGNLKRQFGEQNFEEARTSLRDLVKICMECHTVYRKHLLKPEEEELE